MKTPLSRRRSVVAGVMLSLAPLPGAVHAGAAAAGYPPAPATPEEVKARVDQLRAHYKPYLRSLPKPLRVRPQVDLCGTWRWKYEAETVATNVAPPAPDWYRVDLNQGGWE